MKINKNQFSRSVFATLLGIIIFSCNTVKCPDLEQTEKSNHNLSFFKSNNKNKNLPKNYSLNQKTKIQNVEIIENISKVLEPAISIKVINEKNNVSVNVEKVAPQNEITKKENNISDTKRDSKKTFSFISKMEKKVQKKVENYLSNSIKPKTNVASKQSIFAPKSTSNNGMILLIVGLVLSLVGGIFAIISPMLAVLVLLAGLVMFIVGLVQVLGGSDGDKGGF